MSKPSLLENYCDLLILSRNLLSYRSQQILALQPDNGGESVGPLRLRVLWLAIGWAYLLLVIYVSLTPSPPDLPGFPGADKWAHVTAYAMLMLWFGSIYRCRLSLTVLGALFIAMGVVLDLVQGTTGYRSTELLDMIANAVGVLLGWLSARTRFGDMLIHMEKIIYGRSGKA